MGILKKVYLFYVWSVCMNNLISRITLKGIVKFILVWILISAIMMALYNFFIASKKTYYKGVFVKNIIQKAIYYYV